VRGAVRRLCEGADCSARHKKNKDDFMPPPPSPTYKPTSAPTFKVTSTPEEPELDEMEAEEPAGGEQEPIAEDEDQVEEPIADEEQKPPIADGDQDEDTTPGDEPAAGEEEETTSEEEDTITEDAENTTIDVDDTEDPAPEEEVDTEDTIPEEEDTTFSFETKGSVAGDTGMNSTCKVAPIHPAPVSTVVYYTYEVKITAGANVEEVLATVEEKVHELLIGELLDCDFSGDTVRKLQTEVQYTAISTLPKDVPFTTGNDICSDEEDCYKVSGGITTTQLPWDTESDIVEDVKVILTDNESALLAGVHSDLRGVDFSSVTGEISSGDETIDEFTDGADTTDRDPAESSAFVEDKSSGPSKGAVAGVVTVAILAVGVVVVALLSVRRRQSDDDRTVKPVLQDESVLLDDTSTSSSSDGFKAVIICDELDNDSTSPQNNTVDTAIEMRYFEQDYSHDPESCVWAGCEFCRELLSQKPEFVTTGVALNESMKDISLPRIFGSVSNRTYTVSDTVDL